MAKPNILYYSDCAFFAGCENMLAEFLKNEQLNESYSTSLMYRYSDLYLSGLKARVNIERYKTYAVDLPDNARMLNFMKNAIKNRYFRRVVSFPFILFWKYYCIGRSTIILYKKIRQGDIDIMHINNGGYPAAPSCYSAVIAAKLNGVSKIVYVANNIAEGYKNPLRWFDYLLDIYIKHKVSYFITGSKHASLQLSLVLNIPSNKLINIPNGVQTKSIVNTPNQIREQYSIPSNRAVFLLGAVLEKRKGHAYLLEAILKLTKSHNKNEMPVFIFAGDGDERNNIKEFISKYSLHDLVILTGAVNNIFDYINAADALILPSIANEDFPFIIIEGMALGKPVIGTSVAGIPEQISHTETGLIVPPKNPDSLKDAIQVLLDAEKRNKFGMAGLKKFNENYTINKSIDQYILLYNKLIKSKHEDSAI